VSVLPGGSIQTGFILCADGCHDAFQAQAQGGGVFALGEFHRLINERPSM
jgi:hypothetical protein